MKVKLKEDPREWRKSALLSALGFALLSSLLRWRHVLSSALWLGILGVLGIAALAAWLRPNSFRGYYRLSARLGFFLSQVVARVVLVVIFLLILTPLGLARRFLGKDPLCLKRTPADSYWHKAPDNAPLDRMF